MLDNEYKNAFKEVLEILKNTDEELLNKIPNKFIQFMQENMNPDYITNIKTDIEIDKQPLLKETEAILSLIYRSYWATEEEKQEFAIRDKQEFIEEEERKIQQVKDISEVFEKRKNLNKITLDNSLMVIKKENFIKRIFKKILNIFKS